MLDCERRASRLIGLVLALTAAVLAVTPREARAASSMPPSIVFILTDDQDAGLVDTMPNLKSLVAAQGTTFNHAYYNVPLCSPSRATILTGQYTQNTGVFSNDHAEFYENADDQHTVALWLHNAGYRTGLIGKYINAYPNPEPTSYVPPGWDYWAASIKSGSAMYDYTLDMNGTAVTAGSNPSDYATDAFARMAHDFIQKATADSVPFYLEVAFHAPHVPAVPAPRDANALPTLTIPRTLSFDEADVSDKPAFVRNRGMFPSNFIAQLDAGYRDRARTLQAVDLAVQQIVSQLSATGRLSNTYIVFASDNGWMTGQHRLPGGKGLAYEEVSRMPLMVRGPNVPAAASLDHLVGNVDLAQTFAEWAGVTPPADCDGRSFAPLLDGTSVPPPEAWRQAYPIKYNPGPDSGPDPEKWPTWQGVRTRQYTYVEYDTGERELYDNLADPYQLNNLAQSADGSLIAQLSTLTAQLNACRADSCRQLEDGAALSASFRSRLAPRSSRARSTFTR